MPLYKLVVLTGPVEGREDEYNDWYKNVHLPDLMTIPGFKSAQRFRLSGGLGEYKTYPYLAIYEIETDDLEAVIDELKGRATTGQLMVSDALDPDLYAAVYEPFGLPVTV